MSFKKKKKLEECKNVGAHSSWSLRGLWNLEFLTKDMYQTRREYRPQNATYFSIVTYHAHVFYLFIPPLLIRNTKNQKLKAFNVFVMDVSHIY